MLAILASGSGSTAEAYIEAWQNGEVNTPVGLIIHDRKDAFIKDRVEQWNDKYSLNIPVEHISRFTVDPNKEFSEEQRRQKESEQILEALKQHDIDVVVLMGYLRPVIDPLLSEYGQLPGHSSPFQAAMINTHPAPTSLTQGMHGDGAHKHMIELFEKGEATHSAHTAHLVSAGYDKGTILKETPVEILPNDTWETLKERVMVTEKAELPKAINAFIHERSEWIERNQKL